MEWGGGEWGVGAEEEGGRATEAVVRNQLLGSVPAGEVITHWPHQTVNRLAGNNPSPRPPFSTTPPSHTITLEPSPPTKKISR